MLPKLVALVPMSFIVLLGVGCAAPSSEEDEGTVESQSFAAKKASTSSSSSDSSSDLAMSGKVSSTCEGAGSATVRVGVELTSGSSDGVVVSIGGALSDSITITSNAWSKMKNRTNWAFVASEATLGNGDYAADVCATQNAKQTCASYAFTVACD
jgi:hypothetical protein